MKKVVLIALLAIVLVCVLSSYDAVNAQASPLISPVFNTSSVNIVDFHVLGFWDWLLSIFR